MPDSPGGTITFLFTDIQGSTRLWERHPDAMRVSLARHDGILREAIARHGGRVFKTIGDAFCAAFIAAPDALKAAMDAHLDLQRQEWGETGPIVVRMAIHSGEAEERDNDFFGPALNRTARLQSIAHGQQTLVSHTTYELIREDLPDGATLQDMGQHRLKDLLAPEHVWLALHRSIPTEFPPLRSLGYLPTNLPRQTTSFIGREREMREVIDLLPSTPLLTLLGTGGTGKTRLALQVGADLLDDYKDGVWIAELGALANPDLVPQSVASALGLREEPGRPVAESVHDYLRDHCLLLILDNCEHLLDACARFADTVLKSCPFLTILATSREALGIPGERAWRVPSLLMPEPADISRGDTDPGASLLEFDSCRLFVERAKAYRQDFVLTRGNGPVVAQLCQRLDGIPLAIELAAARIASLSVDEINARLDNRFRLLTGGSRTALPRQQTLRALVDWSYDLLNDREKGLLCRLSVFAGGWTLEGAEAVGVGDDIEEWEILDLQTSLVMKSLVVAETEHDLTRYRLLQTVRQYARDRLEERGQAEPVLERHQAYYAQFAEQADVALMGPQQGAWLDRLECEHDNLRAALRGKNQELALRIAGALARFWTIRGYFTEGMEWLTRVRAAPGDGAATHAKAKALRGAGVLARAQGSYEAAQTLHKESLEAYRSLGDKPGISACLFNMAMVALSRGDYADARTLYEQVLALDRELGDKNGVAVTLQGMGALAHECGDYDTARTLYEESLAIGRESGNPYTVGYALNNLGSVAHDRGDYVAARALYEQSLGILRELGNKRGIAAVLQSLAQTALSEADYATAQSLYEEALATERDLGNKRGIAASLHGLGLAAFTRGEFATARALFTESLGIERELGNKQGIADSLDRLGAVVLEEGDCTSARTMLSESIALYRDLGSKLGATRSLESFADLNVREGRQDRAVRLWGAAERFREELGSPASPGDRNSRNRKTADARAAMSPINAAANWAEGRAMTLDRAIEYALDSV